MKERQTGKSSYASESLDRKEMNMGKKQPYKDSAEQRLSETEATRQQTYGKSLQASSKSKKK